MSEQNDGKKATDEVQYALRTIRDLTTDRCSPSFVILQPKDYKAIEDALEREDRTRDYIRAVYGRKHD